MMRMLGYAKCPYPAQNSREVLYCYYKARARAVLCSMSAFACTTHQNTLIDIAKNLLEIRQLGKFYYLSMFHKVLCQYISRLLSNTIQTQLKSNFTKHNAYPPKK